MLKTLKIFALFFITIVSSNAQSSCLPEGISFSSAAEINTFKNQYPECTHIIGHVYAFTISSLDGLQQIKSIGGDLGICCSNWQLDDLEGLNNLEWIGGYLHLSGLDGLNDLSALSKLKTIGSELKVFNNDVIENLDGLENLTQIGGYLDVQWNPRIKRIDGLRNVTYLGGNIEVDGNDELENIDGLFDMDYFDGSITITDNPVLINLSGLSKLDSITEYFSIRNNSALTDLSGLENLKSVGKSLSIQDNIHLASFEGLHNLETIGNDLSIRNNDTLIELTGFPSVSKIDGTLTISSHDQLESISAFNNLTDAGSIMITNNESLQNILGFENLLTVGSSLAIRDNLVLINLDGFNEVKQIGGQLGISENTSLLNLDAFSNLRYLLGSLSIYNNENLFSIIGLENINPNFLQYNTNFSTDVYLKGNPSLSECQIQPICRIIENGGNSYTIRENGPECDEDTDFQCSRNSISGTVYFDRNENGIKDANEYGIDNHQIILSGSNYEITTNQDGRFKILCDSAETYTLSIKDQPEWQILADSQYTFVFIPGDSLNTKYDFPLYPTQEEYSGMVSLSSSPTRCNTSVEFNLKVRNTSYTLIKGRVELILDPLTSFISASEPLIADLSTDTKIVLETDYLYPFEYQNIVVELQMPSEQETGSALHFEADLFSTLNENAEVLDHQDYDEIVLCSYDPNDKNVSPAGQKEANYTIADEKLTYTIRFQNTGNAEAIDIRILDTISQHLDMNTLDILDTSFPMELIVRDRAVEFYFKDIYLPDSTSNEPLSHGFVTYRITPNIDAEDLSIIENTAHIIFDFNPAIITNTTSNTLVDSIGENVYISIDTFACEGDTILGLFTDGIISDTVDNGPLCLFVQNLNVHFTSPKSYTFDNVVCRGDSIDLYGSLYSDVQESFTVLDSTYTDIGCVDSVITNNIDVYEPAFDNLEATICQGDTIQGYTESGMYTYPILNQFFGCFDSIKLDLTVIPQYLFELDTTICEGYDYLGFDETGVYTIDSLNSTTGCMDVFQINLDVLPQSDPLCITNIENSLVLDIEIYPNPFREKFSIISQYKIDEYTLYNSQGSIMTTEKNINNKEHEVSLEPYPSGIFYIHVMSKGEKHISKIIKL